MCGIAGANLSPLDNIDALDLAQRLLLGIEHRGTDATGAAWFQNGVTLSDGSVQDNVLMTQKDAITASYWIEHLAMPSSATNFILHTRYGTKGSEYDNDNNHPVITGGIVGVHNGGIWNDDSLFRKLNVPRIAQVDTEAAFAAIAYGTEMVDGKHRLAPDLKGVLEKIDGSAALAWLQVSGDPNVLHLARVHQSPVVYTWTEAGSFIFASTEKTLTDSLDAIGVKYAKPKEMEAGTYWKIENGARLDSFSFEPLGATFVTSYKPNSYAGAKKGNVYQATSTTTVKKEAADQGAISAFAKATVRKATGEKFTPFLPTSSMHLHITHLLDYSIPVMPDTEHHKEYEHREKAIERYIKDKKESRVDVLVELGAFYRVGDWVKTDLSGQSAVAYGQILMMPQSFPTGDYLLKLGLPNKRWEDGTEPIIVTRQWGEFEPLQFNNNPTTTTPDKEDA